MSVENEATLSEVYASFLFTTSAGNLSKSCWMSSRKRKRWGIRHNVVYTDFSGVRHLIFASFVGAQMGLETKRPRLDNQVLSAAFPSPFSSPATTAQRASRRSTRQRRGRDEKEITVSSDQTLLDLKREVCSHPQQQPTRKTWSSRFFSFCLDYEEIPGPPFRSALDL